MVSVFREREKLGPASETSAGLSLMQAPIGGELAGASEYGFWGSTVRSGCRDLRGAACCLRLRLGPRWG